jgi:hypothetical protein
MEEPTPWTEGAVVSCSGLGGSAQVLNLQTGWGYARQIVEWKRANAVVIVADGAVYFVRLNASLDWKFHDGLGIECVIAADERNAFISTYTDVVMIDLEGQEVLRRTIAIDGVELSTITEGTIVGRQCYDPPDGWAPFRLSRANGSDA